MHNIRLNYIEKLDYRTDEAYKRLRSNIQLSGENVKVMMVTSCVPNDGKSTISLQLAISFAQLNKKVLIIDADMRHSVNITRLRITGGGAGLSNYLAGKCTIDDVIAETNFRYMDMVLPGPVPPNPAELLSSSRFESLISFARENYDYVIVDTPPMANVVDAQIASKVTDGMILVVAANAVSARLVGQIMSDIETTGATLLGFVLNKVDMSGNSYYGKYYGKYYGEYYQSDSKKRSDK